MKKTILSALMLGASIVSNAQINVAEPDFVGSYWHMTSDSTYNELPKENGTMKHHENKVKKASKLFGGISSIAGAAGMVGVLGSNSLSGIQNGAKVMGGAAALDKAADVANTLGGASGMDIAFQGGKSAYSYKKDGKDMQLIIRNDSNSVNPADIYRVVRFNTTKKQRSVLWMEYNPSLIGSSDAEKNGYIAFKGKKYGDHSYLLTIPDETLEEGQYGIFYMNVATALAIPVATFGVTKK